MSRHWTPIEVNSGKDGPEVKGTYIVTYDDGTMDILRRAQINLVTGHGDPDCDWRWVDRKQHRKVIAYQDAPTPYSPGEQIVNLFLDDKYVHNFEDVMNNPNIDIDKIFYWNGGVNIYYVTKEK